MRTEGLRRAALLAGVLALSLSAVSCGGGGGDPFRIGVIADCVGINRPLHDAELSGAELPLIEKGAELRGQLAGSGVTATEVAGRPVELVPGCTELWELSALTAEARRLIEREDVDAIVGAGSGVDEIALRDVARLYPDVVFLPVAHGPREITLQNPPPNLFRFSGDHGQGVAGLGAYAYRRLGWRDAAVVLFNWDMGWGARDAFASEFCALGGRIGNQVPLESFTPADVAAVPRDVDGVAVFVPSTFDPAGFINRLAARYANPARHILVGPSVTDDPTLLGPTRRALTGVVGSSYVNPSLMRGYLDAYRRTFPGASTDVAGNELVSGYRDAVRALLAGLEDADGNSAQLPAALAHLRIDLLGGPVRLDRNRQAVISTTLVRIEPPGSAAPGLAPVRTIGDVDQSIGGLLDPATVPSDRPARCVTPRSSM